MPDQSDNDSTDNTEGARGSRQRAVALEYSQGERTPRVVAVGAGEIARRIIELAAAHNVPIQRDDSLVEVLGKLDIGYEIPVETYRAVAEILAFLYRTDESYRQRKDKSHPQLSAGQKGAR